MEVNYNDRLIEMQKRLSKYDKLKGKLKVRAGKYFSKNIFNDYFLPDNFNFDALTEDYFRSPTRQEIAMPFSNKQFDKFIHMKKKMIGDPIMLKHKGHLIHGGYFIGAENGKKVLFAFSIITDAGTNIANYPNLEKYKFSIKLEMLVCGKSPLMLLRFDSIGAHPNLIKDGKVAQNSSDVEIIYTPHIHKNDEMTQVLCYDNLDYNTATKIKDKINEMKYSQDSQYFKTVIKEFMENCNIDVKLNKEIQSNYFYDFNNYLFDFNN